MSGHWLPAALRMLLIALLLGLLVLQAAALLLVLARLDAGAFRVSAQLLPALLLKLALIAGNSLLLAALLRRRADDRPKEL